MELQRNHTSHIDACDDQRKTTAVAQQAERQHKSTRMGQMVNALLFLMQIAGQPGILTASRPARPCPRATAPA